MVRRANLDNLTKGARPALHAAEPNFRFDYGDIIDVSEDQVESTLVDAESLLDDVLRAFPKAKQR